MTHNELLEKIQNNSTIRKEMLKNESIWQGLADISNALRVVVELHKPKVFGEGLIFCSVCLKIWWDTNGVPREYPCPTIQAIKEELA